MEEREGYYNYMLRRYREEDSKNKNLNTQYYNALIRIKELNEEIQELKDKVEVLENANLHNH